MFLLESSVCQSTRSVKQLLKQTCSSSMRFFGSSRERSPSSFLKGRNWGRDLSLSCIYYMPSASTSLGRIIRNCKELSISESTWRLLQPNPQTPPKQENDTIELDILDEQRVIRKMCRDSSERKRKPFQSLFSLPKASIPPQRKANQVKGVLARIMAKCRRPFSPLNASRHEVKHRSLSYKCSDKKEITRQVEKQIVKEEEDLQLRKMAVMSLVINENNRREVGLRAVQMKRAKSRC